MRASLDELGASTLAPAGSRTAADGTVKLLLETHDGSCVETVMMPYQKRVTVCISSQVGCPVGCAFCATGAMGFRRNLSVAEIVDQLRAVSALALDEGRRVSNLVYMGMGEPLLNLQAVLDSIRVFTDPRGMNLAHRALSVSTVGIPSGMLRLGRTEPQVNLALSLHAADDTTRARLIPRKYLHPLSSILEAAWRHFTITHRKLLIEYVLLRGVNDSPQDARRLAGLLRGHVVTVNLLSWNPVVRLGKSRPEGNTCGAGGKSAGEPGTTARGAPGGSGPRPAKDVPPRFQASPPAAVALFRDVLADAHVEAVVRQSRGAEIQAACGQLAGQRQQHR
jgi:23S rRNA (adenine2503-C2)-methyltransferase